MEKKEPGFVYDISLQFYIDRFVDAESGYSGSFELHNGVVCKLEQPSKSSKISVTLCYEKGVFDADSHRPSDDALHAPQLREAFEMFQLAYAFVSSNIITVDGEYDTSKMVKDIARLPSYSNDFEIRAEKAQIKVPNWLCTTASFPLGWSCKIKARTIDDTVRCLNVLLADETNTKSEVLAYFRNGLMSVYNPYNFWRWARETIPSKWRTPKGFDIDFLEKVDDRFSHSPARRVKYELTWANVVGKHGELASNPTKRRSHYEWIIKKLINNFLFSDIRNE